MGVYVSDVSDEQFKWAMQIVTAIMLGMIGGGLAWLCVVNRSFALAWSAIQLQALFLSPWIAGWLIKRPNVIVRRVGQLLALVLVLGVLYTVVRVGDQLYFNNADTYPTWLTKTIRVTPAQTHGGGARLCPGQGLAFFSRKDNGVFLRCGDLMSAGTYYVENYDEARDQFEASEKPE